MALRHDPCIDTRNFHRSHSLGTDFGRTSLKQQSFRCMVYSLGHLFGFCLYRNQGRLHRVVCLKLRLHWHLRTVWAAMRLKVWVPCPGRQLYGGRLEISQSPTSSPKVNFL